MKNPIIKSLFAAAICFSFAAHAQDNGPMQITTTDGKTYHNATVIRSDPDGLLVSFEPERPGFGMAKVKFRNLPDDMRNRYKYDADKASAYEADQAKATAEWRSREPGRAASQQYRNMAETIRSVAGDAYTAYWISLDANGKAVAHGYTGNVPPDFLGNIPPYYWFPMNNEQAERQYNPNADNSPNRSK